MLVHIRNPARMAIPNLSFRNNDLLSKPLRQDVIVATAKEANVHRWAVGAEQKISGTFNCTHVASPLPNGLLLPT